jgi:CMP-N-acetylneuraminic acid synthetase
LRSRSASCLAVIPARGGSKRLPDKNIRIMLGKPLIAYSIEVALKGALFEKVVVSTDSEEIAELALRSGADVPFLRDPELADDQTPVSSATVDALEKLDPKGEKYGAVAQLMPNCPLRTTQDILDSYKQFWETSANSQISVTRYGWQNPWWAMERNLEYTLVPLFEERVAQRSQDLPDLFCPTGVIWWARADVLRQERTYHVVGRTGWEIPWQRAVDIDTEDDWQIAEILMMIRQGSPADEA